MTSNHEWLGYGGGRTLCRLFEQVLRSSQRQAIPTAPYWAIEVRTLGGAAPPFRSMNEKMSFLHPRG